MFKKINVIGLGYIGLPTALMLAKSGVKVVGTEHNEKLVCSLQNGELTFEEIGLKELFEDLNSPTWFEEIERQRKLGNLNKLLVVKKDHCALGFTGPIFTEPSGRGYLSGVGIHSKVRARGLGKTMFCELCLRSKENGAKFMTLFTGSDNKARNIYLYAGMRIVKSFAIMRKDFK